MLAATRIGAIHIVVFAGFGAGALADRLGMAGARAVFTADVTWRRGREVPLKEIVDQALAGGVPSVERVVVLRRGTTEPPMTPGRDIWWDDFLALANGQSDSHEVMESNEPAFILATSGTTAKPKLAIHTHGPYQVGITSTGQWCHGLRAGDVWWATSDIGWIVGHSYIVYAPLLRRCDDDRLRGGARSSLARDGVPDHRGEWCHRHLHLADRSPLAHEVRERTSPETRPFLGRARGLRW